MDQRRGCLADGGDAGFQVWLTGGVGCGCDFAFAGEGMELLYSDVLDAWSQPGESEGALRARLAQISREARDEAVQVLRAQYARKAAPLEERLRRSEASVAAVRQQLKALDTECSAEITALAAKLDAMTTPLNHQIVAPLKKNIDVTVVKITSTNKLLKMLI